MNQTELAYRKTALGGASGFGLLIALYDTLAGDMRRAADAERNNNIEKRCRELKHALLVVAYLEDWIGRGTGGELADRLVAFYSSLRRKIIEAQAKRSPEILEQQIEEVLSIRGIWQGVELRDSYPKGEAPVKEEIPVRTQAQAPKYPGVMAVQYQRSVFSWSA